MKILIWLPYIPYPLDSGGNKAIYSMIDHLRTEHHISIGLNIRSNGLRAKPKAYKKKLVDHLKKLWPEVTFYLYEGQYNEDAYTQGWMCKVLHFLQQSIARKYKRAYRKWSARHELGDVPRAKSLLSENAIQYNPGFLKFVKEISGKGFDVIQAEMYEYLFLGYLFPKNVKRIFIHHELRFIRLQNELALFHEPGENDLLAYEQEKASEIAALKEYDYIVTLTETDRKILSKHINKEQIITSPAAIITPDKQYTFSPCQDFVFVGSGEHEPNADGLKWFANEILPILRSKQVSIKLYIVGKWNEKQCQLYRKDFPEIIFTGFIDDLSQFLNGKISIIPIRMGSGMRIKIIEAVNAMSPFITTSKGVEGLTFQANSECFITDKATDFAEYMISLQNDIKQQQELTLKAYNKIKTYYNSNNLFTIRKQIYD